MDIIRIAQREADRSAARAQNPEDAAAIYFAVVTETRERGYRAEEIIKAGLVAPNGRPGQYHVRSQNGGGTYTVDLEARECNCPDHTRRGTYCKHLQAAELYRDARDLDAEPPDPMTPDYEALGNEPVTSQYQDSRDAAGYYTPARTYHHGLSEEAWEYADYCWDSRFDSRI